MNGSATLNNKLETWRMVIFMGAIFLIFGLFIARLFSLQVLENDKWTAKADGNSTQDINMPALRGIIYDRNGIVLARNVASYNVVVTAASLPDDPGAVQEIFRQLSILIKVPVSKGEISPEDPYVPCVSDHGIAQIVEYGQSSTPYDPVKIKCDIDQRTALLIQEKAVDWPGISVEIQPIRDYPTNDMTSSIIGFLGPIPANREAAFKAQDLVPNRDKVGYAGIEMQYQDLLAGKNGHRLVQVDVGGKVLRDLEPPQDPSPGYNIQLTIDTRLQEAAYSIIRKELTDWNNYFGDIRYSSGVIIAINPKTGEVLAMVSYPTYENQRMARIIPAYYYDQIIKDPTNPLLNHAVGDVLPVGSVFKLVTGTGALNEGVVTPDQVIETPPELIVDEKYYANDPGRARRFVDWNKAGFGQLDFVHGLANSSNVYFYKLGGGYKNEVPVGLGICRLRAYAEAMGYNATPNIGLPEEQKGLIPDPTWKRINQAESWSSGDTYITSVGQGYVLGTPLQVLMSATVIADGGKLMQPTLVRGIQDGEGNIVDYKDDTGRQLSPFQPKMKWDLTKDAVVQEFNDTSIRGCEPIPGKFKTVQSWVFDKVREGMRLAVTEGTLVAHFKNVPFAAAGKTGTAEYCDQYANAKNRCLYGRWPSHAWTLSFAPYDNPEIAVVAFVYNGTEGSTVAGPIVRKVLEAYFNLKAVDNAAQAP